MPNISARELRIDLGQFRRYRFAHEDARCFGEGAGVTGTCAGRSKSKPVFSMTSSTRVTGVHALAAWKRPSASNENRQRLVISATGPPVRKTFGALAPGAR